MEKSSSGFSLIELLVVVAISAIAMSAIYNVYINQVKTKISQERIVEMQQNIRLAISVMEKDIRMAGYDPDPSDSIDTGFVEVKNYGVSGGGTASIEFTYMADCDGKDNNNNNLVDSADPLEAALPITVKYSLGNTSADADTEEDDLGRSINGSNRDFFAGNIDRIEFYCHEKNGTKTLTPTGTIKSIQLTILARTENEDPDFNNTETYTTPGGQNWTGGGDGYHRLMMSQLITCRNM